MKALLFWLLLLTAAWADPTPQDFGGWTVPINATFSGPTSANGATVWEAQKLREGGQIAVYGIRILDADPNQTVVQLLGEAERYTRALPYPRIKNLRVTNVTLGSHPGQVIDGVGLAPNAAKQQTTIFVLSVSFVAYQKLYQLVQISFFGSDHAETMASLPNSRFENQTFKGIPTDEGGEYTMLSIPFVVRLPGQPIPYQPAPAPHYQAAFNAAYGGDPEGLFQSSKGTYWYYLRQLKPDDKRGDAEIFRELAGLSEFAPQLTAEQLIVQNGSGTLVHAWDEERGGNARMPWNIYFRYERVGNWVAVLCGKTKTSFGYDLKSGMELRRR